MSTIFAVSSGAPPAAIAILRLSGADAFAAVRALAGEVPPPRIATLRALRDPADGSLIDRALVLIFPAPTSATGEDVAELHLHGGRATVRAAEAVLARLPGLRAAEPGEFTRRALMNGRIDLSEAEGLGDLLMAETEAQRRAALANAEGGVRRRIEAWQGATLECAAYVELLLDHADEEDATDEAAALHVLRGRLAALQREIATVLSEPSVERLRDGIRVVLGGPPNSGKSTLLNALADREAAIVSPIAGTTRDRIEAPVTRDGVAWLLIDTAGLADETADPIEAIGVDRSYEAMRAADIVLWLGDEEPPPLECEVILIHARADIPGRAQAPSGRVEVAAAEGRTGDLWHALAERASALLPRPDALALNRRQRHLLEEAERHLVHARHEGDLLLVAESLRCARNDFDAITGRAGVEEMLDVLFGRFCIGK